MIRYMKKGQDILFFSGEIQIARLIGCSDAEDTLTILEDGIFEWRRQCRPVKKMCMELETCYSSEFYLIPGINYNGNGFGTFCEYEGDRYNGVPWVYGWHRAAIPAMTMSQDEKISVSLIGKANDGESCSLFYKKNSKQMVHRILWPEEESPKQLRLYRYADAFQTKMEPRTEFCVWIVFEEHPQQRAGYHRVLDFSWKQNYAISKNPLSLTEVWSYGIDYAKSLYTEEANGFCGFNIGLAWENENWEKRRYNKYEIGWCGQNALLANELLCEAIKHPEDMEARRMGFAVLDSWIKYASLPIGVVHSYYDPGQVRYLEACNLGTAGVEFFDAYDLSVKLKEERKLYLDAAFAICDFAVRVQKESGAFAKCWHEDGSVAIEEGSVGAFLALPLVEGYRRSKNQVYLKAAKKALRWYGKELTEQGFTTAGALDIFSIDKESAIPLLKGAVSMYREDKSEEWLVLAENAAWYLSTWQYSCTEKFSKETTLGKTGYDSFGGTLVSTVHEGMDSFALSYVPELYELGEQTGQTRWIERAKAIWRNGCQHVSDGTMIIDGHVRPKGSQDESFELSRQSVMGSASNWLVAWPGAFRMDIVRKVGAKIE